MSRRWCLQLHRNRHWANVTTWLIRACGLSMTNITEELTTKTNSNNAFIYLDSALFLIEQNNRKRRKWIRLVRNTLSFRYNGAETQRLSITFDSNFRPLCPSDQKTFSFQVQQWLIKEKSGSEKFRPKVWLAGITPSRRSPFSWRRSSRVSSNRRWITTTSTSWCLQPEGLP